jgi:hypothetical protein
MTAPFCFPYYEVRKWTNELAVTISGQIDDLLIRKDTEIRALREENARLTRQIDAMLTIIAENRIPTTLQE